MKKDFYTKISMALLVLAIFSIAFFIPKTVSADCYKGAEIHTDYNFKAGSAIWTRGIGSTDPNAIYGFRSMQEVKSYIDVLTSIGRVFTQCNDWGYNNTVKPQLESISATDYGTSVSLTGNIISLGSNYGNAEYAFDLYEKGPSTHVSSLITPFQRISGTGRVSYTTNYPSTAYSNNFCFRLRVKTSSGVTLSPEKCFYKNGGYNPPYNPNPGYNTLSTKTTSAVYRSYENRVTLKGYLSNLSNLTSAQVGFCIYEANYGFNCNTRAVANYYQRYAGSYTNDYYTASLKSNTKYCVRAYAENTTNKQRSYASSYEDKCFTTSYSGGYNPPYNPSASVKTTSAVKSNNTVRLTGYLNSLGGGTSAKTGFCIYKKNYGFNCNKKITANNYQRYAGSFTANYSTYNLDSNTQYCVRAFSESGYNTTYANTYEDKCFYAGSSYGSPTYQKAQTKTSSATYYDYLNRLDMVGNLSSLGGDTKAEVGFCIFEKNYGFNCNKKAIADSYKRYTGTFYKRQYSTSGLKSNTQYCVRTYAVNSAGTSYASSYEDKCFTTKYNYTNPGYNPNPGYNQNVTVSTYHAEYSNNQVKLTGYLLGSVNSPTEVGFYLYEKNYGFNYNKTKVTAEYSKRYAGSFTKTYSTYNLKSNTKYCVRAYAGSGYNTIYENSYNEKCFTTSYSGGYNPPYNPNPGYQSSVKTSSINYNSYSNNVSMTGSVTNPKQGSTVGFCVFENRYGFNCTNDVVANRYQSYTGTFTKNFSTHNLKQSTKYCVRAYVKTRYGAKIYSPVYYDRCFTTKYNGGYNPPYNPPYNPSVKVSITKSATRGANCQTADIRINVNCLNTTCNNVVVYDVLPSTATYVSGSSNPNVSYFWNSGKTLVWSLGRITKGNHTIVYRVKFNSYGTQRTNEYGSKVTWEDNGIKTKNIPIRNVSVSKCY